MALIKCPECGHQVSDTADTCPQCGYSISEYIHQEKLKQKRKIVDSNPDVDDSWVKVIEKKVSRKIITALILFPISVILFVIFSIIALSNIDSIFLIISLLFLGSSVLSGIFLFSNITNFTETDKKEGSTILFYKTRATNGLFIDGEEVDTRETYEELTGILPSGTRVHVYLGDHRKVYFSYEGFEKFEKRAPKGQKTIVNNYVTNNITKTGGNTERSDMEKILIKNAKIDALASIDPTNTEKSKKQIEIVKELDDLD